MARATLLGVASLVIDDMSTRPFTFRHIHLTCGSSLDAFYSCHFKSFFLLFSFFTVRLSFQDRTGEPPMMNRTEQNARAYWEYQGTHQDCHVMSSSSAFWEDVLLSDSSLGAQQRGTRRRGLGFLRGDERDLGMF